MNIYEDISDSGTFLLRSVSDCLDRDKRYCEVSQVSHWYWQCGGNGCTGNVVVMVVVALVEVKVVVTVVSVVEVVIPAVWWLWWWYWQWWWWSWWRL